MAVFYGGQVLYIARESQRRIAAIQENDEDICELHASRHKDFEFIGECYVDGMMDGQALDPEVKQPDICIRLL